MIFLKKYKEIILYFVFGVLTTAVNFLAFLVLGMLIGEELYLLSNFLAWGVAVAFAFVVNKIFVFEARSAEIKTVLSEIIKFVGARVFSLGVEELGLFLLVDVCNMGAFSLNVGVDVSGHFVAKCILAVIVVIMNYFFSKFIIFKREEKANKLLTGNN